MGVFHISLLVQGLGCLFLVLVCGALYVYRRRPDFLCWTLAGVGYALWLLLSSLAALGSALGLPPDLGPGLRDAAVAAGCAYAALWGFAMLHFRRGPAPPGEVEGRLGRQPADGPPLTRWHVLALLGAAAVGVVVSRLAPAAAARSALLPAVLLGVYAWSAALFFRDYHRRGFLGSLLLTVALALYAAEHLHFLVAQTLAVQALAAPPGAVARSLDYLSFADALLQVLTGIGLIVLVLNEEHAGLRDALARLADSEDRFRLVFEHSGVGMTLLAADGRMVQVNPALVRLVGYEPGELRGRRLADLTNPEGLGEDTSSSGLALADPPDLYERERCYFHKDGHAVWTRMLRVPVRDPAGRVRYLVGVVVDITEARQAREALREERDFSTQVLETAGALIVVLDLAGRIVRFNGKCSAVSGYREDEVRGRVCWELLVPPRYVDAVRAQFTRLVTEQSTSVFENPWVSRTGEERLIAWRKTTVRDAQGRLRYVIGTGLDITDQRRLEEQLRHAHKMETLGTLVGGIAHDFNNQLAIILGNLGLVLEAAERDADAAAGANRWPCLPDHRPVTSALADAERAGRRCADMTQRLLTFGRRRTGPTQLLDLNLLLDEAARLLRRVLPAAVRTEVRAEPGLWKVHADSTQVHQVLMNLAVNGRDAMPEGGTLTLATANQVLDAADSATNVEARPGRFVVLTVTDTGTGMTPEVQRRLFEPFFTTKEVGQGTGLGLAMVFGIVKAHQGWIRVHTLPGRGTTFTIYLPAAAAEAPLPALVPAPAVRGGSECILVVDDEELLRNLARSVLQTWGFQVLTAADGDEALALYRQRGAGVDLVLLDYSMPRLNGLQVLHELRALNPGVRVVFSSGYTAENESGRLLAAGARAFVAKPYRPEELVATIRQVLDEGPKANGHAPVRAVIV